jgi:CheY-like chemotaxis protein
MASERQPAGTAKESPGSPEDLNAEPKPAPVAGPLTVMAGGLAHDLNNVLAPIVTAMEVLQMRTEDEKSQELIALIRRHARHGAELTQQIATLAEGVECSHTSLEPGSLLRDLRKFLVERLPENIVLEFQVPEKLWAILGSLTQIYRALLDLCLFAAEAMPEGGTLRVSAENRLAGSEWAFAGPDAQQGRYVEFTISDTSQGIPTNLREQVFEPGYIGQTGFPRRGLHAMDKVIKAHHGQVTLSEEGRGNTFKVYLPAAPGAEPELVKDEVLVPRGHGECILLVEDEEVMREVARQTFEYFGYRVLTASNGADAVAKYLEHRDKIALVFTDISMPVMNGLETIKALRKMDEKLKIVATSGHHTESQHQQAEEAGATHFLPKPYEAHEILELVEKMLKAA